MTGGTVADHTPSASSAAATRADAFPGERFERTPDPGGDAFVGLGPEIVLDRREDPADVLEGIGLGFDPAREPSESVPLRFVAQDGGNHRREHGHEDAGARAPEARPRPRRCIGTEVDDYGRSRRLQFTHVHANGHSREIRR